MKTWIHWRLHTITLQCDFDLTLYWTYLNKNKIIFLCNSHLTHGHRSVGHPLFKEATGVINLLYRTMTMAMNRNTHLCNFKSDTTIILTRNVTWNSSAPNATPITSYPLTRAMAGGAPCWPAQHCHLRAKALLNWLQPYSLVAWNREACLTYVTS